MARLHAAGLAAALLAFLAAPGPAHAAFPGANGQIVYTCANSSDEEAAPNACVAAADGSGNRRVITGAFGAAWSPDGVHLAYLKERASALPGANPEDRLSISPAGSSGSRTLPPSGFDPAWSPDGRLIAYEGEARDGSGSDDRGDIWVVDLHGNTRNLTAGVSATDSAPAWSPDGRLIAFASNREDGRDEIYTVDVASRAITRITRSPAPYGRSTAPNWSPDGSRLAFARRQTGEDPLPEGSAQDLYVINADGTGERALTDHFGAGERDVIVDEPAWSPDGSRIVFSFERSSSDRTLRTIGADGSGEVSLPLTGYAPDWGPAPGTGPAQPLPVPRVSGLKLDRRAVWAAAPALVKKPTSRDGAYLRFKMSTEGVVLIAAQELRRGKPRGKPIVIGQRQLKGGSHRLRWLGVNTAGQDLRNGTYRIVVIPVSLLGDLGAEARTATFRMLGTCLDRKRRPCQFRR